MACFSFLSCWCCCFVSLLFLLCLYLFKYSMAMYAFIIIVLVTVCMMENGVDKYTTVNVPHERYQHPKRHAEYMPNEK